MTGFVRPGRYAVTPRIITPDVVGLVGFIRAVFEAEGENETERPTDLTIGGSTIMVSDGGGIRAPIAAMLYVYVADADATFRAATEAGAEVIEPPGDRPWGDRVATIADRWGNIWQIATWLGETG